MCEAGAIHGWRVFFLGAGPGVAQRASEMMAERYPGLEIAGHMAPRYDPARDMGDDEAVVEAIRQSNADIVLVAYGMPKQDLWGYRFLARSNATISIGIGGTFDMMCGDVTPAPRWVVKIGMEFVWRVLQEPRRLLLRYLRDASIFRQVAAEARGTRSRRAPTADHDRRSREVTKGTGDPE